MWWGLISSIVKFPRYAPEVALAGGGQSLAHETLLAREAALFGEIRRRSILSSKIKKRGRRPPVGEGIIMAKTIGKLIRFMGIAVALGAQPSYATSHPGKTIQYMLADGRACIFFTLNGVSEADPVASSQPWFALPKSASNFAELNAMLLSAKLASRNVSIQTDGTTSCGFATATMVQLD